MKLLHSLIMFSGIVLLSSCTPGVQHYEDQQPSFVPSAFFNGQLQAVGIVQDFKGEVTRRFTADIVAEWQGNRGVLDEQFVFDDGEEQSRCWRLTQQGDELTGTAGDVIGEAKGQAKGNTLNWQYVLRVAMDDGDSIDLHLDDWLYLVTEDHLINRTQMHKFGLPVGEITLAIHRTAKTPARALSANCRVLM